MIELDRLRLVVGAVEARPGISTTARGGSRRREPFLKGPIPWAWLHRAGRLPGRALHVGLAVWHLSALQRSRRVRVNLTTVGSEFGVDRTTVGRALERLAQEGLVEVDRHDGRCPVVLLLDAEE